MIKRAYIVIASIVLSTMVIGSWLTQQGMAWYQTISLPVFTPPRSVFPLVWTALYLLTALAACLWWKAAQSKKDRILISFLFVSNAVLNGLWSYLFFYRHLIGWAIIDAIALFISLVALIYAMRPITRWGAILLWPYAAWVAFAVFLNTVIWLKN
jgi:tryptophan-rich sensory protein